MASQKKSISVETVLDYSIDAVWQALTDKDALSQWLMQTDFEPIVGKRFQFRAQPMRGWRGYVDCEVLEVVPHKRLVFSWQGMPEHSITTMTYELEPRGEQTLLRGIHHGFDHSHGWLSGMMLRAMLKAGWRKMLRRLLPQTLVNIASGRPGGAIVNNVNCYDSKAT